MSSLTVHPVPCLTDNYAYLVICTATRQAAVVDPGEAAPVIAAVATLGVTLRAVWATHHHADHVAGITAVLAAHPGIAVVGYRGDAARIPGVTQLVDDGDAIELGELRARILFNPGHTLGAISYLVAERAVFTGDTLFAAGCGRLFEGTAAQLHASLLRLAALPPATEIYFGHEYTAANLRFAAAVEPDNVDVAARIATGVADRDQVPTTPSTIAAERATNPFLRTDIAAVQAAAMANGAVSSAPVDVFAALRSWKNDVR